ncbi:MAG: hypothetical protein JKY54_15780 [Flavobacteriales bacterium]|nr:hypothetical protein [Flavobacteriales bacterium]
MRQILSVLSILFLCCSCYDSADLKERDQVTIDKEIEKGVPSKMEVATIIDMHKFDRLFSHSEDSIIEINAAFYEGDGIHKKIDSSIISKFYQDPSAGLFLHCGMVKFNISERFTGYVIGNDHYEGKYCQLWVFDNNRKEFKSESIYVAANVGDAGEHECQKGWITDLNGDGVPELLQRTRSSFLEIDADEADEEISISNVSVFEFSKLEGNFTENKTVDEEQLNQRFTIDIDEM